MMKRVGIIVFSLILIMMMTGCNTTQHKMLNVDTSVSMKNIKEKYQEFFAIEGEPFKGIELYVWQMADGVYYCGLMFGTNRNKTHEEILALQEKALTVDETKALLSDLNVSNDTVVIYPIAQPYSSYLYAIDDAYRQKVSALFEGCFVVMGNGEN